MLHLVVAKILHVLRSVFCEGAGIRTQDTRLKRAVLCRLSYTLPHTGIVYRRKRGMSNGVPTPEQHITHVVAQHCMCPHAMGTGSGAKGKFVISPFWAGSAETSSANQRNTIAKITKTVDGKTLQQEPLTGS